MTLVNPCSVLPHIPIDLCSHSLMQYPSRRSWSLFTFLHGEPTDFCAISEIISPPSILFFFLLLLLLLPFTFIVITIFLSFVLTLVIILTIICIIIINIVPIFSLILDILLFRSILLIPRV
ncbi:hypothetical protein OIU76_028674 [Salix suchowensis]|uniref:Uncharacterized protein n=1 Tax=Salix koriyanagi TaxID=2511006 RepID=A0A9Q0PMW3_9ROSI|nr:hypothetical protein OIU76_028674 [Salix suchowensis]KAJ6690981.1 hypothetical protein OIU74_015622 [Salix koriyanagi]